MGTTGFVIAALLGGPLGGIIQRTGLAAGVAIMLSAILISIAADILAVAAAAGDAKPLNAMAADRVPGAREALAIVRNAGRVNSVCADVVGDICGTISGVAATPVILSIHKAYPAMPLSVIAMGVLGAIAFFTIGGKAAEKTYAVRSATSVLLFAGKGLYSLGRVARFFRTRRRRA